MPQTLPWTPWHKVVTLREDVRTGELSLADFAADLHDVATQKGVRPVYEDPGRFFALTYPTFSLRELARDVALRLAGKNTKAIRQLELTYGGGKTHTLVTLRHLACDPESLPPLPAVEQFRSHAGAPLPAARVAALCFDKLDVEKGMEVLGPAGELRWLRHPWSVLAFQVAGADGLRLLHPDGANEERETPPAEPLLTDLLSRPQAQGLATLVLIDEVLMYAREKAAMGDGWRDRLIDFFQHLCQATVKVDRCALVASLLASDPAKGDAFGKELTQQVFDIFNRQREAGIQPVQRQDVAEVLRRRFFEPASIADADAFRPHVTAAVANIAGVAEAVRKRRAHAEQRFLDEAEFPDASAAGGSGELPRTWRLGNRPNLKQNDLWRADEASRRVKDLAGAFAENPRLPKMLRHKEILDTIDRGVRDRSGAPRAPGSGRGAAGHRRHSGGRPAEAASPHYPGRRCDGADGIEVVPQRAARRGQRQSAPDRVAPRRRFGSRASRRGTHRPFRPPVRPSQRGGKNGLN